jgi:hypothetical protein
MWAGIMKDPDLNSSDLLISLEVPAVARQTFLVQTSLLSGAGSSGTSTTGTAIPNSASAASSTTTTSANVTTLLPDQLGVTMQWWIKGINLPMTRSCLMGNAL